MVSKLLSLPLALALLAGCQSTSSEPTDTASSSESQTTATTESAEAVPESENRVAADESEPMHSGQADASQPVTYRGEWIFEGQPYPFKIEVMGDNATYTDLGAQGKSWQASSVTRQGDRLMMELEDYKFQGYPYDDIGLTVVGVRPDGSCDRVDWHGAAAFTRQADFTAECSNVDQ